MVTVYLRLQEYQMKTHGDRETHHAPSAAINTINLINMLPF